MRRVLLLIILACLYTFSVQGQSGDFVEAFLDIETPYIGQPVIYTIKVFTNRDIQNTAIVEPRFGGFGRSSFVADVTVSSEARNGTVYTVIEHALLIYPLRAGEQTIEPLRIEIPETPFESAASIQTQPIVVDVLPLPDGAPASFKNAVGQFDLTAEISQSTVMEGNTITLSATINGSGNIEQIIAPDIPLADSWRVFPQQPITDQSTLRFATKTFQWTLLPEQQGEYEIPAIEFSFFNPQIEAYETRITSPFSITVNEGGDFSQQAIIEQNIKGRDVPPLRQSTEPFLTPIPPTTFWLLWLIAPVIALIVWIPQIKIQRVPRQQTRRRSSANSALERSRAELKSAQQSEPRLAYQMIHRTILNYVSQKKGFQIEENKIQESISHLPPKLQRLLLQIVEEAESGQYAPVNQEDVQMLVRQTMKILNAVEKVWQ